MRTAKIVIDLGFGDGGKGLVVDNLCKMNSSKTKPLVVRFSGGQQCGHTVMGNDGTKHVFSSFGSGSLQDCPTFFTEDTTMYLTALMNEYKILSQIVEPKLIIHPRAKVTTPYDVAYNRAKEEVLSHHGSCGLGVGATMKRNLESPYKIVVQDLLYADLFVQKLLSVEDFYLRLIGEHEELRDRFNTHLDTLVPNFIESVKENRSLGFDVFTIDEMANIGNRDVVFEGSQGVMLDMDHGVFPHVTFSNTTSKNAWKHVNKWGLNPEMVYVTRCYTSRHGVGWMPNEGPIELINNEEEINKYNDWQGEFRLGEFSYPMINQSIQLDTMYHGNAPLYKNLVLTCIDQRPDFKLDRDQINNIDIFWENASPRRGHMVITDMK